MRQRIVMAGAVFALSGRAVLIGGWMIQQKVDPLATSLICPH
jgi:hypothetical protein